jgi:hypothetical protein
MLMRKWVPTLVLFALLAPAAAFSQSKTTSPNPAANTNSKSGVYEQLNLIGG